MPTPLPATASPARTAQVLEDAADLLLIHGRCRGSARRPDGSRCLIAAMAAAEIAGDRGGRTVFVISETLAYAALCKRVGSNPVRWNDTTEDDDVVRDTLLLVAKDLRNTTVPA